MTAPFPALHPAEPARRKLRRLTSADRFLIAAIAVSLILWVASLPLMQPDSLDDFGIVSILPWQYWSAVGLLSTGFAINLVLPTGSAWPRRAALATLILLLHATPALVYGTLRYSWAWKHIGIIDFILRNGDVDRSSAFLGAYHNWPGFFWVFSWLAASLHMGPIEIANAARFFPVLSNGVFALLLATLYRRFTTDERLIHAALWVFLCANWIGQDYFSPQAVAYALYLLILGLCLGPLMPAQDVAHSALSWRWRRLRDRLARTIPLDPAPSSLRRILALVVVASALLFTVASHQLTPLILIFSLGSLAVTTRLGTSLPLLAGLMMTYWVLYPASPFTSVYLPDELARLGRTVADLTETLVDTTTVDLGVAVVVWAGRALTVGVVLLAVLGWVRRLRTGAKDGVVCGLLIAPTLTLAATSYGGEAVFRIFFFSLPFIAFLCAGLFFPSLRQGRQGLTAAAFALLSGMLITGFLLANNGKDRQYRFSPDEVAASLWLYGRGQPGTLLVEGARNYPSQFLNYEDFIYLPLSNEAATERTAILADPAHILDRWFSGPELNDGYVILTRSQGAYLEAMGIMPKGALERLALDLMASPDFLLVYANRDARIFRATRFIPLPGPGTRGMTDDDGKRHPG